MSGLGHAVGVLRGFLATLPDGHPDRRGVARAIEVLRGAPLPAPLAGTRVQRVVLRATEALRAEADAARAREQDAIRQRDEALRQLDAERRGQRYAVHRRALRARVGA